MNKVYKVIWNATLGTWVAVSELAKGYTKSKSGKIHKITASMLIITTTGFSTFVLAEDSTQPVPDSITVGDVLIKNNEITGLNSVNGVIIKDKKISGIDEVKI